MLLSALIDSMVDEMYPLLDFYASALSGLDDLIGLQGPERVFVTTSRKLKRRVQSLRRYAWDVRQLLQELRQNQFGVMCVAAKEMMETVEVNTNNMVEVSQGALLLPPHGALVKLKLVRCTLGVGLCQLQHTWSSATISSRYSILTRSDSSGTFCTCLQSRR